MGSYSNPYDGLTLFSFLKVFLERFLHGFKGVLATDEIQIGVLCAIAVSGALVGSFFVLRKMTMLANALSHTVLLGIVSAYLLFFIIGRGSSPDEAMGLSLLLIASFFSGILTTFLTDMLYKRFKLQEDASIGIVFTTLFAAGILLVTLFTRNVHVGTELIMGNVDALKKADLEHVSFMCALNVGAFCFFYRGFKLTTFDAGLARTLGFSPSFFHYLLMILASMTCITAFKAVGALLVLAFFVFPPLTARFLTNRLVPLLVIAAFIGSLSALIGVAISRHFLTCFSVGLSTAGLVVCLQVILFFMAAFFSKLRPLQKRIFKFDTLG